MPTGLEVFLPDGSIKLTNEDPILSLRDSGVISDSAGWSQEGTNSGYFDVTVYGIQISSAPMIAVRSSSSIGTWAHIQGSSTGAVTFRIYRTGSGSVEWFVFSPPEPAYLHPPTNPSNSGLELYNSSNQLVFASETPVARPIGIYSNSGYSGLSLSGRTLAHAPIKQRTYSYTNYTHAGLGSCNIGGQQGYQQYSETGWSRTAISVSGSSVNTANRFSQFGPVPTSCSLSQPSTPSFSRISPEFSSLILDVSNF